MVVVVVVVRGWIYVSVSGCLGYKTGSVKIYTSGKKVGRVCSVSPYVGIFPFWSYVSSLFWFGYFPVILYSNST